MNKLFQLKVSWPTNLLLNVIYMENVYNKMVIASDIVEF